MGDNDVEVREFDATLYLDEVEASEGPLAEAPFLERKSSLSFNYLKADVEDTQSAVSSAGFHTRYIFSDNSIGDRWFIDADYQRVDVENVDSKDKYWGLGVGAYVLENTAIGISYVEVDPRESGADGDGVRLRIHHYQALAGTLSYAIDIDYLYSSIDNDNGSDREANVTDALFSLYFNRQIAATIGYGYTEDERGAGSADVYRYSLGVDWFINPALRVHASYTTSDAKNSFAPDKVVEIGASLRF